MTSPDSGGDAADRPTTWQSALRRAASLGSSSGEPDGASTALAERQEPDTTGNVPVVDDSIDDSVTIPPATFSIPPLIAPTPSPGVSLAPPAPPAPPPPPPSATVPSAPIDDSAKSTGLFAGALSATLRRFGTAASTAPKGESTEVADPPPDVDVDAEPSPGGLPEIQELTPTEATVSTVHEVIAGDDARAAEGTAAEPPSDQPTPMFEASPAPTSQFSPVLPTAIVLPPVAPAAPAAATAFAHAVAHGVPAAMHHGRPANGARRGGSVVAMLFTLMVLAGLVTAAIVFGRPYLFPDEWDQATRPYADAVTAVRGVEFTEPLVATAEPSAAYQQRMVAEVLGDWKTELPTWRALGVANGVVDDDLLDGLIAGWKPALYSSVDGQVYYDADVPPADLDALVTEAMAVAALDQDFGMVNHRERFELEEQVLLDAEVLIQSRAIQRASAFPGEVERPDTTPLVFAPPVVGYRLVGPLTYAPLLDPEPDPNPLADLATVDPGPLPDTTPVAARAPVPEPGDTIDETVVRDRSFWYLVFAGYLPARQAYDASEAIVETSLAPAVKARGCTYATFSGGDLSQTEVLTGALSSWVAAVPPEFTAALTTLDDGTVQLRSCDPGNGFVNGSRLGVAHELIGWRSAEIAAVEGVISGDVRGLTIDEALQRVRASDVGAQLAARPFDASPEKTAADARRLVIALL